MFVRSRVIAALEAKKDRFNRYQADQDDRLRRYREALQQLPNLSRAEILARLEPVSWPGALPSVEHDDQQSVIVPFARRWHSHQEARNWAGEVLRGQTVLAVDGSQIPPSRDFSVPVAAVQIGWFENPHDPDKPYVKDLFFEVLPPSELFGTADLPTSETGQAAGEVLGENQVNLRRFQQECARLVEYMETNAHRTPSPLCFLDGSLVISFAAHMNENLRRHYVDAVVSLLETSARTRVPLVGYVDTSYARDVCVMLKHLFSLPGETNVNDGQLLSPLLYWGDRSPVFSCARDDEVLPQYGDLAHEVNFTYVKTTAEGQLARIEMPAWLVEDRPEKERILDLIRAECVVGNGYPYALETADAVAVISMEDRERFLCHLPAVCRKRGAAAALFTQIPQQTVPALKLPGGTPMRLGKIVKSNSHNDYVCQIDGPGDVPAHPAAEDYAFGTFARIELEESGPPTGRPHLQHYPDEPGIRFAGAPAFLGRRVGDILPGLSQRASHPGGGFTPSVKSARPAMCIRGCPGWQPASMQSSKRWTENTSGRFISVGGTCRWHTCRCCWPRVIPWSATFF